MLLLDNKTAVITGASRGIGRAIALRLASEGCQIAFTFIDNHDQAQATLNELTALGVKAKAYQNDASDFEAVHKVINHILADFGRIDILVNNAGIVQDTLMMRMTEQQWDSVIDVNLKSVFNFIHAVTPIMVRQKNGSIMSMSSIVGLNGNVGQANYAASKAGIIALTKSVAKELGGRGIRVNAIAPGYILTDMTRSMPDDYLNELVRMIPMRRAGTPDDVAGVALFLASDMSQYVSGQVIQVNGAMG